MKLEIELFYPLVKMPQLDEWVIAFENNGYATMVKLEINKYTKTPIFVYIAEVEELWPGDIKYWAHTPLFKQ